MARLDKARQCWTAVGTRAGVHQGLRKSAGHPRAEGMVSSVVSPNVARYRYVHCIHKQKVRKKRKKRKLRVASQGDRFADTLFIVGSSGRQCKTVEESRRQWKRLADTLCSVADSGGQWKWKTAEDREEYWKTAEDSEGQ